MWFLLGDVLKSRRLAILDTQDPQLKRIADIASLKGVPTGEAEATLQRNGPAGILTQVFSITYLDVQQAVQVLRPFLSEGSSLVTELADSRSLIVTDYATNIKTVNDLLQQIDRPANEIIVSYYEARFRVATTLAEQVKAMIAAESTPVAKDGQTLKDIFIEASGKHVLLAGSSDLVARVTDLLRSLDVDQNDSTQVYRIKNTSAARIEKLARALSSLRMILLLIRW